MSPFKGWVDSIYVLRERVVDAVVFSLILESHSCGINGREPTMAYTDNNACHILEIIDLPSLVTSQIEISDLSSP